MAIARVVVGSLVAHAAVFAVMELLIDGAPRASTAPRAPVVELVEPATAPIEIVFVEPAVVASSTPLPHTTPKRRSRGPVASIAVSAASTATSLEPTIGDEPAIDGPAAPSAPKGSMNMRARGTGPDLAIHRDVPRETPAVDGTPKNEKTLQQDGTEYVVPDLVTTMHVSRDGRARFVDKPDITVEVRIPKLPSAKEIGDHLQAWYRDPYAQKFARRYQDMPRHEQAVPGGWDAGAGGDANIDGSIKPPERMPGPTDGTVPLIGGKLDITSWLHRKFIGDPYASRKRALLDGTHEERARIRERFEREQLDDSAITMQKNVERVFREIRDPADRRAALFALWDECIEGNDGAGEAGQRARAIVIGAIRGRLSDRYTDDEIAALDARRTSVQHFVPYD